MRLRLHGQLGSMHDKVNVRQIKREEIQKQRRQGKRAPWEDSGKGYRGLEETRGVGLP